MLIVCENFICCWIDTKMVNDKKHKSICTQVNILSSFNFNTKKWLTRLYISIITDFETVRSLQQQIIQ